MINRALGRELARKQPPLTAGTQQIKDCVQDGTKLGRTRAVYRVAVAATEVRAASMLAAEKQAKCQSIRVSAVHLCIQNPIQSVALLREDTQKFSANHRATGLLDFGCFNFTHPGPVSLA